MTIHQLGSRPRKSLPPQAWRGPSRPKAPAQDRDRLRILLVLLALVSAIAAINWYGLMAARQAIMDAESRWITSHVRGE